MVDISNTVVVNSLLAVGLAVIVSVICARIQQPAICHMLWLLVLLRLLIPPVCVIDLSKQGDWLQRVISERAAIHQAELQVTWQVHLNAVRKATTENARFIPIRSLFVSESVEESSASPAASFGSKFDFDALVHQAWAYMFASLITIWLLGSVLCLANQLLVALRFRKRLRAHSYNSRIWQRRADKLAKRMGLTRCPRIRLVRDSISPMLWGLGSRAQILLPDRLFEQLDRRAQNGLLCHELAHYQRGDHWVRLLESIAMIAYWWHPVFWWAKHEIEKAEEQCCDAIAVDQAFGNRRSYAEALLKAIDFVSTVTLPPAASGAAARNGILRRRIELIMSKRPGWAEPRKFGPGLLLIFAVTLAPFPTILADRSITSGIKLSPNAVVPANSPNVASSARLPVRASVEVSPIGHACNLNTDECHRTELHAQDGTIIDLGVGRVAVSAWSHSNDRIAVGTTAGGVEIFSTVTGESGIQVSCGHSAVSRLAFSLDDQLFGVANQAGELMLFDASGGIRLLRVRKQDAHVVQFSFGADQSMHVVWSKRGSLSEQTWKQIDGCWQKADK